MTDMVSVTVVINVDMDDEEDARMFVEQYLSAAHRYMDQNAIQDWYTVEACKHD